MQVGFAVADGSDALLGFTNALNAPGAMTVPIQTLVDGCASQQLTLVKKASNSCDVIVCSTHTRCTAVGRPFAVAISYIGDSVLQRQGWDTP